MKASIIILSQSIQQPRVIKRIIELSFKYKFVNVYTFERELYQNLNSDLFDSYSNISIYKLGTIRNKFYIKRLYYYLLIVYYINKRNIFKKLDIYVFGQDLRFISIFSLRTDISYEISDIMWLYFKGFKRIFFQYLDYFLCYFSKKVFFTSKGYYLKYFSFLGVNKIEIRENKFNPFFKVSPILNVKIDKIRIVYVGAFRYTNIIKNLINSVVSRQNFILSFYGDGDVEIKKFIFKSSEKHSNIFYHGPFKNPDDLGEIYENANINFVAYDNTLDNEKVAMPNKFYESGFFNIPIVGSENTYLGRKILELDMGWSISPTKKGINLFLDAISINQIIEKSENIKKLNKDLFTEN